MTGARDIEDRAARWLVRREDPAWSEAEQIDLDRWLAQSMANKAAYWRLEHGWRQADRIGALGPAPAAKGHRRIGGWPWQRLAIAASVAVLVAAGAIQLHPWDPQARLVADARFSTPIGSRQTVPLTDGSSVELNTATVVRTAVDQRNRDVWLDQGEAYFEVAHVEGRPFVVHAGNRDVTVLGTKFSVRREGEKVTVSVVEGRVRVEDVAGRRGERSSIITAGDVAISRGASTLLTERSAARVESALSWREGMIVFDQITLAEAASEFNRYNVKPIVIADPDVQSIRIGGTFEAANVAAFVRLLRDAYGLRVTNEAARIKISR